MKNLIPRDRQPKGRVPQKARLLPHKGVYVRLAPSKIHGLGVFAIRDIPRGAHVFGDDDGPIAFVAASSVETLEPELRMLYEDFCVLRDKFYICPASFNQLTPAWYLNHSETPNLRCDESLRFSSITRISKGEELTVDYRTYSDEATSPKHGLHHRDASKICARRRQT